MKGKSKEALIPLSTQTHIISPRTLPARYQTLEQLFRYTQGVYFSSATAGESARNVSIRGLPLQHIKFLLNGVSIVHEEQIQELLSMPVELIDKVIILKGPQGALFGSGAMGGVVDIRTQQQTKQSRLTAKWGDYNYFSGSAQIQQPLPKHNAHISLLAVRSQSRGNFLFSAPGDSTKQDNKNKKNARMQNNDQWINDVTAQGSLKNKAGLWQGQFNIQQDEKGIPGRIGHFYQHVREKNLTKSAQIKFSTLYKANIQTQMYSNYLVKKFSDPYGEQWGFPDQYQRIYSNQGIDLTPLFAVNDKMQLIFPLKLDQEKYRDDDRSHLRNQWSSSLILESNVYQDGAHTILLTPHLSIHQEKIKHQLYSRPLIYNYGFTTQYLNSANYSLSTNLQTAHRLPTFDQLYLQKGLTSGNSQLQIERSIGGDINFNFNKDWINFSVAYFTTYTKNLIEYMMVSGFQYRPYNFGQTQSLGWEGKLDFNFLNFFNLENAITWQDVKDISNSGEYSGKKIPGRPDFYGYHQVTFQWPYSGKNSISTFIAYQYALHRYINQANNIMLPNRHLWDFGSTWKALWSTEISFTLQNIFDHDNIDLRGYPLGGRSAFISLQQIF